MPSGIVIQQNINNTAPPVIVVTPGSCFMQSMVKNECSIEMKALGGCEIQIEIVDKEGVS